MSNSKRAHYSKRCAVWSILLGFGVLFYPPLIVKGYFFLSMIWVTILTTVSALNIIHMNKKMVSFPFSLYFFSSDDVSSRVVKKHEIKEFSVVGSLITLLSSVFIYAGFMILLGARWNKDLGATLYFSSLLTVLTVYPLLIYYLFSDSVVSVMRIVTDSKFDNVIESTFQYLVTVTLAGAWMGAFPVPLDWDRPWQTWPVTCCVGAALGNGGVQIVQGLTLFFSQVKDKRKVSLNRSA